MLDIPNPVYFIESRSGNASNAMGNLPSNQPLMLDRNDRRDSTTWQLGLYHLENAGPADSTSITFNFNVYARVTIKFEGVKWDVKTWYSGLGEVPPEWKPKEDLVCRHCGHKGFTTGNDKLDSAIEIDRD